MWHVRSQSVHGPGKSAMTGVLASPLSGPTPLASLVWSFSTVLVVVALLLALQRPQRGKNANTWFDHIISGLRAADRAIVHSGSWVTGTRYEHPNTRRLLLL